MKFSMGIKCKILSLVLAITLMLGSIVLSTTANGNATKNTEPQNSSAIDTSLTNYLPMVLDSNFFHIYWTGLSGNEKDN